MSLHLRDIRLPLAGFMLEVNATLAGSITGVFGPSGAGKTSLLELIAGLRPLQAGAILLDELTLCDPSASLHLPPRQRRIGYVPQDLALFPHLKVRANVLYGHRTSTTDTLFTLDHVTQVMEIAPLLERQVTTLSGGEQQRVAFARAVLSAPRLLLLDEPMSSLDSRLKARLIPYLHRIRDEFQIPLIYVSHNATELAALCDEVLIMESGRITQRGAPREVFRTNSPEKE